MQRVKIGGATLFKDKFVYKTVLQITEEYKKLFYQEKCIF